ncbi:MAG: GGDEF domain-containing protein [Ruminococcaceae bacterium]|nr:GGDEF domain-containing protein [Oscillospiraceae bacterium]
METSAKKERNGNGFMVALNKAGRYLVKNALSFTVAVMGLVHLGLVVIFLLAGVLPLVRFNCLSVIVYIFCYILCRFGHIMPAYFSIVLEVTVYTIVSTYYVGLRCGTYCFLFSIVPIIIYFGCNLYTGRNRFNIVLMLILNFITFIILYTRFSQEEPMYEVAPGFRLILVLYSAFAMVFATIFYNAIYIYSSENKLSILEKKNRQLSADAHEDALTSLLNRRGFLPLVKTLMRSDEETHFCIAFCDLDDFKRVNDSYGHEAGDEVLKHVTTMIREELPGCDICRWGGEEFVILLKECDLAAAKAKVERLRKTIESNPTVFFSKQIFVTTTIGLEENKDGYREPEEIIKKADVRMYYGKQHGKNVLIFEDAEEKAE